MSNKKIVAVKDDACIIEAPIYYLRRQGFDVISTVSECL